MTPAELETLADEVAKRVADRIASRPRLVDRVGLSKIIGLSVQTIDRRVRAEIFPTIREGSRLLFDPAEVIEAMKSHRKPR